MSRLLRFNLSCLLILAGACGDDSGPAAETDSVGEGSSGDDAFVFADDDAFAYTQADRVGMPAVVVALIASKDAYNAAEPANDADFADEIVASVTGIHDALDDDLIAAGLTPCEPSACVETAAPFVIPDTLAIDASADAGFPNGRMLPDQVMDVTLALVLLDLETHPVTTLAALPLNPAANDVPFAASFPYLGPAHSF